MIFNGFEIICEECKSENVQIFNYSTSDGEVGVILKCKDCGNETEL